MKNRFYLLVTITLVCLFPINSYTQTSIFPKIGFGHISLNNWDVKALDSYRLDIEIDKHKHKFFFLGAGIEQKIRENLKIIFSSSYSSKVSYIETSKSSWGEAKQKTQYHLIMSDISIYHKIFSSISLGGGINYLNLRNFKFPDEELTDFRKELESQTYNYWGYHLGINYEWKSLGLLLQYSQTKISKKDLAKEYFYPVKKIPLLTFSILYKIKLGKIKRNKKEGCPTF